MTPDKRIVDIIFIYVYIQKSVESVLSLVPRIEALALPDKSKRATPIQRQISCNNQDDKKSRVNTNIYSI